MDDDLTISREDTDAIFAALRSIGRTLKQIDVKDRDSERHLYVLWNNLDLIRLRLNKSGQAELATHN